MVAAWRRRAVCPTSPPPPPVLSSPDTMSKALSKTRIRPHQQTTKAAESSLRNGCNDSPVGGNDEMLVRFDAILIASPTSTCTFSPTNCHPDQTTRGSRLSTAQMLLADQRQAPLQLLHDPVASCCCAVYLRAFLFAPTARVVSSPNSESWSTSSSGSCCEARWNKEHHHKFRSVMDHLEQRIGHDFLPCEPPVRDCPCVGPCPSRKRSLPRCRHHPPAPAMVEDHS